MNHVAGVLDQPAAVLRAQLLGNLAVGAERRFDLAVLEHHAGVGVVVPVVVRSDEALWSRALPAVRHVHEAGDRRCRVDAVEDEQWIHRPVDALECVGAAVARSEAGVVRAESGRKGAGAAVAVRFGRGDVGVARHERVGLGKLGGERGLRRVVELHEALAVLLVAVLEHSESVELGFGGVTASDPVFSVAPRRVVARARRCERRAREREDRERDDRAERESPAVPASTEAGSEQQYPGRDDKRGFEADRGEIDERRRRGVPRL